MSGKLIMKRKLCKEQSQLQSLSDTAEKELPSTTNSRPIQFVENNDESSTDSNMTSLSKRLRCDTPPPESDNSSDILPPILHEANHENFINNQRNRHLLEAIQSKMLELQQELDEFEQDFEVNEEDFYNGPGQPPQAEMSEQEAEALGYAMCAQETMLFLQREGVPPNSLLYTRLRDALVGRGEHDRAFQI